jgi:hydrocephalus-inducing protein
VKRKPTPLLLNVKGEGYGINHQFSLEMEEKRIILTTKEANVVDFKLVQVNDTRVMNILCANEGKFPFDFSWKVPTGNFLSISPGILFRVLHSMCQVS